MVRSARLVLPLMLLSAGVAAQPVAEQFAITAFRSGSSPTGVMALPDTGGFARLMTRFAPGYFPSRIVMAEDNRDLLVLGDDSTNGRILRVSPGTGRVSTALTTRYPITAAMRGADGAWIVVHGFLPPNGGTEIWRTTANSVTTVFRDPTMHATACTLDPATGDLIARGAIIGQSSWVNGYFRIDLASGAVASMHLTPQSLWRGSRGTHDLPFDAATGSWVDIEYQPQGIGSRIVRVSDAGSTPISPWRSTPYLLNLSHANDRRFPIAYHAIAQSIDQPPRYWLEDYRHDGTLVRSVSINVADIAPFPSLTRIGRRTLAWFLDAPPNRRTLRLDVPGEGARPYVVGFSLAGTRPGPTLPDGRVIPLVPDALTGISMRGGIPGVLSRTIGTLDANGTALVTLDLNGFGSALRGLRVWAAAVVIDPAASSGIAHVAGPAWMTVR